MHIRGFYWLSRLTSAGFRAHLGTLFHHSIPQTFHMLLDQMVYLLILIVELLTITFMLK